ncbi:pyruvate formate-lyase-activating protein [Oryzibacter oryziterrae]|uniref:pyruvate formate-lyase-activating protein n=1 Tax=Oryzibacter oryziterrae TaxID=2766474 RepID=UPI001F007438|nr:pyruvate formate-lyase-activating protein [Oryzibacter oryziterrae]
MDSTNAQLREVPQPSRPVREVRPVVRGFVHSSEAGGAVDGPGVRFVLFVSGCPLRCQYCHNPDTWHTRQGKETTSREALAEIASYSAFLKRAHGGVTISGGEPMVQPDFLREVLHGSKAMGLHTAIDTSGYLGHHIGDDILADIDLVLLDIKAFSEATYHEVTGVKLKPTLDFARRLAAMGKPIWLRYVLVPGLTDKMDEISELARFAAGLGNVERVDVLPFHKMGEFKWDDCGRPYKLKDTQPPSAELTEEVRNVFRAEGLLTH